MKAHATEHGVLLVRNGEPVETLTASAALDLALELLGLAASADNAGAAEGYGRIEWISVGKVARVLGVPRTTASRIVARMTTVHARVPGGDRFVALAEVNAWAARCLGVARRRKSAA